MLTRRSGAALGTAILIALLGAGCGGSDSAGSAAEGAADERSSTRLEQEDGGARSGTQAGYDMTLDSGKVREMSATRLPEVGPSVIKTAELSVEVARGDFQESVQRAVQSAARYGGFVFSTTVDDDSSRSGTIVIRVPSVRFEEALDDLKGLGDTERESISGQDVSQEFVDLRARQRNLEAQEAVLLELMNRARSVTDTIRVQSELQGVQLDIERIRGQLRYLEDQTDFGTITAHLSEAGAAASKPGTIERAWQQAVEMSLRFLSTLIVASGVIIPLAILALIAYLIVRQLRPRTTTDRAL
jgi:Domain of unknown function (DUF4349)